MPRAAGDVADVADGCAGAHPGQWRTGRDQLAHREPLQLQGAGDLRRVAGVQGADVGRVLDQVQQGLGAVPDRHVVGGLHADPADQRVGGGVEHPEQRAERPHERPHRQREEGRRPLRVGDRPRLRRHLPHHQVDEGDHDQGEDEPQDVGGDQRQPPRLEQRGEPVVHGRLGDRPEGQGADGDAQLRAGQQQGQLRRSCAARPGPPCWSRRRPRGGAAWRPSGRTRPPRRTRSARRWRPSRPAPRPRFVGHRASSSPAAAAGAWVSAVSGRRRRTRDGTCRSTASTCTCRTRRVGSSSWTRSAGSGGSSISRVAPSSGRPPWWAMTRPAIVS